MTINIIVVVSSSDVVGWLFRRTARIGTSGFSWATTDVRVRPSRVTLDIGRCCLARPARQLRTVKRVPLRQQQQKNYTDSDATRNKEREARGPSERDAFRVPREKYIPNECYAYSFRVVLVLPKIGVDHRGNAICSEAYTYICRCNSSKGTRSVPSRQMGVVVSL